MKRIGLCMAICATIGCGSSPSPHPGPITPVTPTPVEPAPSAPRLAGAWSGMFDVSSCTGDTSEACRTTGVENFSLHLDGSLYGVAEMEPWRSQPLALDIIQTNRPDGSTLLKGVSTISSQPLVDLEIQIEGSAPSSLTGSVRYTISGRPPAASKSSVATRSGPILFIRQVTTVRAGALQGTWRGFMKRTACSGDCDYVRETTEVNFWFSQQGSNLSGIFHWGYGRDDELEGTAAGQEFTFARAVNKPNCGATYQDATVCQDSVDFRGSADSLGRMRGTIQRRQAGIDYYDGPFSWTATFELEGVVRAGSLLSR